MAKITFDNVRKDFGKTVAVKNHSFSIEDGEFFVLLGPSGCGKSTTMRLVSGLEEITEGTITIGGEVVNDKPPSNRDIAMVFQEIALYPHMTVAKNISSPLRSSGYPTDEVSSRVKDIATKLEIGELLDRHPRELSGGQRQRVAIGRALVREPRAFLLDEPFSSLDQMLRIELQKQLKRLQERTEVTTIFVTHNQEEAMVLADRIAVMRNGTIEQIGSPEDIYRNPANRFVANFIGNPSMNFFDVTTVDDGLRIEGKTYDFPRNKSVTGAETMAARPEDIEVHQQTSGDETLIAKVELLEMHGGTTYLICDLDGKELTIEKPRDFDVQQGDRISLSFDFERINFFDGENTLLNATTDTRSVSSP